MPKSKFKSKYLKNKEKQNGKVGRGRHFFDCKTEAEFKAIVTKLEQAWALGCSDTEAAFYAGISKAGLSRYIKSSEKIAERKELLKCNPVLISRQEVIKAIQAGNAKLALKLLERVKRDEFALRQENVNTTQEAPDIILEDAVPQTKKKKGVKK